MNYSNFIYFDGLKSKIIELPNYLIFKKSLNLKKNYIIKNFPNRYLHFIDDDTNLCPFCYLRLFKYFTKNKTDFIKINRKDVLRFTKHSFSSLHKVQVIGNNYFEKIKFTIANSSVQLIFYNKKLIKFRNDRGLGKINWKISSENIFISENFKYSSNLRFQSILLNCPLEHLSYSSGEKRDSLKFKIKSGHLKIILKNLFKKSWVFFYSIYLLYLLIKKFLKLNN